MSREMRNDNKNKRQARKRWNEQTKRKQHKEGGHRLLISKRSEIKSSIYSHNAVCMATQMDFFSDTKIDGRMMRRASGFVCVFCSNVVAFASNSLVSLFMPM